MASIFTIGQTSKVQNALADLDVSQSYTQDILDCKESTCINQDNQEDEGTSVNEFTSIDGDKGEVDQKVGQTIEEAGEEAEAVNTADNKASVDTEFEQINLKQEISEIVEVGEQDRSHNTAENNIIIR